jgi:hypothetical protein
MILPFCYTSFTIVDISVFPRVDSALLEGKALFHLHLHLSMEPILEWTHRKKSRKLLLLF